MVFYYRTVDLTEDPPNFAEPDSSTSSSTTPCDCTFTKTIVTGVLASTSNLLAVPPAIIRSGCERPSNPLDLANAISKSKLRTFTLKELQAATRNFSDKFVVGRGGFGKVYKALLSDGSFVAIKRSKADASPNQTLQLEAEIEIGSTVMKHRNLIPLIGVCVSKKPKENILVYPFKINGDLGSRIREPNSKAHLDWPTRKRILLEAARGLCHLHESGIIHRDIKASNILLDENLEACIGDFGIAMILDKKEQGVSSSEVQKDAFLRFAMERVTAMNRSAYGYATHITTSVVVGTLGFMAPEYNATMKCTVKNDVYSFGVTILEVITGQNVYELHCLANDEGLMFFDYFKSCLWENKMDKLLDPGLRGNFMEDDVQKTLQLSLACTLFEPEARPSMLQVVRVLEGAELSPRMIDEINIEAQIGSYMVDSIAELPSEELSGPR